MKMSVKKQNLIMLVTLCTIVTVKSLKQNDSIITQIDESHALRIYVKGHCFLNYM